MTEQDKTLKGITPENKWLTLNLVFAREPSSSDAYDSAIAEVTKAAARNLEIHAYVFVGDKSDTTTWNQLKDADEVYICVNFDPKNRNIFKGPPRRSEVVKHLP